MDAPLAHHHEADGGNNHAKLSASATGVIGWRSRRTSERDQETALTRVYVENADQANQNVTANLEVIVLGSQPAQQDIEVEPCQELGGLKSEVSANNEETSTNFYASDLRDAPALGFHYVTAVVLLDPQQSFLRGFLYALASFLMVIVQIMVVMSIIWGTLLPPCSVKGATCSSNQVCNTLINRCYPCGAGPEGEILKVCRSDDECVYHGCKGPGWCLSGMCVGSSGARVECDENVPFHLVDGGWCENGERKYLCPLNGGEYLKVHTMTWRHELDNHTAAGASGAGRRKGAGGGAGGASGGTGRGGEETGGVGGADQGTPLQNLRSSMACMTMEADEENFERALAREEDGDVTCQARPSIRVVIVHDHVLSEGKSWDTARDSCVSWGGDLLKLTRCNLKKVEELACGIHLWLGAHVSGGARDQESSAWTWAGDMTALSNDSIPYKRQDRQEVDEGCGVFSGGRLSGGYVYQEACSTRHGYVCEMPFASHDEISQDETVSVSHDGSAHQIAPCSWMKEWCGQCNSRGDGVWQQWLTRQKWNYGNDVFDHGMRQLASMKIGDHLTVLLISVFISTSMVNEVKEIYMDRILVHHFTATTQVSRFGRLSLAFLWFISTTRKCALVPCVGLSMPMLLFCEGAFSLQVAMNGVALLFLLQIDDLAYIHLLSDETKELVETIHVTVQVKAPEKRMLGVVAFAYLPAGVICCTSPVWSMRLMSSSAWPFDEFNSVAVALLLGMLPLLAISPLFVVASGIQRNKPKDAATLLLSSLASMMLGFLELLLVSAVVLFNTTDLR